MAPIRISTVQHDSVMSKNQSAGRVEPNGKRRTVVAGILAGIGGAFLWRFWSETDDRASRRRLAERLVRLLGIRGHASFTTPCFAKCSLDSVDATRADALVGDLLAAESRTWRQFDAMTDNELRDRLRRNMANDFLQGRIHVLDGWRISATEMRALKLSANLDGLELRI